MKLVKDFPRPSKKWEIRTSITLGTFDGVHIGHRRVLQGVINEAKKKGEKSLVITFDRHPLSVLKPGFPPRLLSTLDEKIILFDNIGIDITCVIPFTKKIAGLTAEQFVRDYLTARFGMGTLIAGYDHGFGKKREESEETFRKLAKELNFRFKIISPEKYGGTIVKSSTIRRMIIEGKVESASELLGRDYSLKGTVIRGNSLGKKIGIPTANIEPENDEKILPASGVYAGWVEFEGILKKAVVNLGTRPTFNIDSEALETHLIEFNGDLYDKAVRIGFIRRLRDIVKFNTQEELKHQINNDIEITKDLIIS